TPGGSSVMSLRNCVRARQDFFARVVVLRAAVFFVAVFLAAVLRPFFGASSVGAWDLFERRMRRHLWRDAAFLWMTLRLAARSRMLMAFLVSGFTSPPG